MKNSATTLGNLEIGMTFELAGETFTVLQKFGYYEVKVEGLTRVKYLPITTEVYNAKQDGKTATRQFPENPLAVVNQAQYTKVSIN